MFTFLKRFFKVTQEEILDPELIIEEYWQTDFHKPVSSRFSAEMGDAYSASLSREGLVLNFDKKNVYAWTVDPLYRYKDFVLEALLEFPENRKEGRPRALKETKGEEKANDQTRAGTMAAGILFRYLSESTFYSVLISDHGMIRMDAVVNNTPIPVLGWTDTHMTVSQHQDNESEDTLTPYQVNHDVYSLRIIARGTSFTVILNDMWVAECQDDFIQAAGKIAFAGQNWGVKTEAKTILNAVALDSRPIEVETVYSRWNQYMRIPAEAHINLAKTWYAMGKYVPAIIELKRAWKNREPGTEELLLSGQVYLAQRLLPEAETQVRKALSLNESYEDASAELGGILYLQNRFLELDDLLKNLSAETINKSSFLSNLSGHLHHWKGAHLEAAQAYARAAALNPEQGLFVLHEGREWMASGKKDEAFTAWLEAARLFLANENYEDLAEVIPLLRSIDEADIRVQATIGKYLYATEQHEEALKYLSEAASKNSPDSAVWYLYGMILSARGSTEDAIAAFRKALELEGDYGLYHFRLAETLFFAGEECDKELKKALDTGADNGWVYNLAALKSIGEGISEEADRFILEARRLLPDEMSVLINYAEIQRLQGRLDEALPLLDGDDADALRAGANLLVEAGRHEEAEDWYLRAIHRRPFDAELLTDRAANCLELDLLNEADDLLGRALDIKPSARIYQLISYLAGKKGEYARSEVALVQGLNEFPDNADLLYDLSAVYMSTNKMQKASDTVKRLLKIENSERTAALEGDIQENRTKTVECSICLRKWRVPKDIPAQGSLHLTAEPPDGLPAGTCPQCGDIYCIRCAKETLGEDGRFRCRKCKVPLKLIDQSIIYLLNRWQAEKTDLPLQDQSLQDQAPQGLLGQEGLQE